MPNKVILKAGEYKDRTGERSGAWTYLAFDHKDHDGRAHWQMICDCGVGRIAAPKSAGYSDECTHQTHTVLVARNKRWREEKILGRENPRFRVIEVHPGDAKERFGENALPLKCECKRCGTVKLVSLINFSRNLVGCDNCLYPSKKYGQMIPKGSTSRLMYRNLFQTWENMNLRCANPKHHRYGARGITVCEEWNFDNPYGFLNFFNWIYDKYPDYDKRKDRKEQLDRANNDLGYSPENCRLVPPKVNANNRGDSYSYNGETGSLQYFADTYGLVDRRTVLTRMRTLNWDLERALLTPSSNNKPKSRQSYKEVDWS